MNTSQYDRIREKVVATGLSHIAFIMDGNGRWAKKRGLAREAGHIEGAKTFKRVSEYCFKGGIDAVTVYAFSTENWKRPKNEVSAIMKLLSVYLKQGMKEMAEDDIRITFLGDKAPFTSDLRNLMEKIETESAGNKYRLNIAMNYGGRAEIVDAVNRLAKRGVTEFSEELIESELDFPITFSQYPTSDYYYINLRNRVNKELAE